MANIKGFAIRGLLKYSKEQEPGVIPSLIAELPSDLQSCFERPILVSQWYPYEAFSSLLRAIDRRYGQGDLRHGVTVGEFAAAHDISGVFKFALNVFNPQVLLGRANIVWSRYCDTGKLVPTIAEPKQFGQRLEGFPGIDEAHCQVLIGFIRKFGELIEAKDARVEHTACVHRGNAWCEWQGTWKE